MDAPSLIAQLILEMDVGFIIDAIQKGEHSRVIFFHPDRSQFRFEAIIGLHPDRPTDVTLFYKVYDQLGVHDRGFNLADPGSLEKLKREIRKMVREFLYIPSEDKT
jgi:hypothetical protein